jgi:Domain of unknown function (DUF5134)
MTATVHTRGRRALLASAGALGAGLRFTGVAAAAEASSMNMSAAAMAHMGHGHSAPVSAAHTTSIGAMSVPPGAHMTNILPSWLAVLWMLAFFAIVAVHARHVLESQGQRRFWHSGHVFMAIGMAFMFAPASVDYFDVPTGFWSLAFANGALAVLLWMLVQAFSGRGTNMLWLVMAFDLGAMAYMWSPSGFQAPLTWLLVAYFAAQALLWGTNQMRNFDERTMLGGAVSVSPDGALTASVAEPLICFKDLRVSMAVMTFGMAYMFAAMQLVTS